MLDSVLRVLVNYIFVQTSILLFFLPFYLVYRYRHPAGADAKPSINKQIENFFLSKQVNYLVFFWAMGEALVWFVIPEFLLLLLVFMRIRRKRELLVYDVGGTVIGTATAFLFHFSNQVIASLTYIQDKMVQQTLSWYNHQGIWGLFYQPYSGVPYKVFTLTANRYHFFILSFIIVAVLIRMSRYLIFFGIFNAIYPGVHKFVYKNYLRLFFIATFIFSLLLLRVVNIYGPKYEVSYSRPVETVNYGVTIFKLHK